MLSQLASTGWEESLTKPIGVFKSCEHDDNYDIENVAGKSNPITRYLKEVCKKYLAVGNFDMNF